MLHARAQIGMRQIAHQSKIARITPWRFKRWPGHEHGPFQSMRGAGQHGHVLGGVPHPARGQDDASLRTRLYGSRSYAIPDHGTRQFRAVEVANDFVKSLGWADPGLRPVQTRGDGPRVMLPSRLAQPFPVVAGESPRIDAGMWDPQHRRPPVEGRLAKAVEMDDIG